MQFDILDKFTAHLRNALSRSIDLAWEYKQESIPPLFLLIALAEQRESIGGELLDRYHVVTEELRPPSLPEAQQTSDLQFLWPEFSQEAKRVIERAALIAFELKHQYIGTEHLLLALLERGDQVVKDIFQKKNVPIEQLQQQLVAILQGTAKFSGVQSLFNGEQPELLETTQSTQKSSAPPDTPALDFFGVDLTSQEQQERLDPVIGRESEIERLVHILTRRTKNNPVLIGEPGVGKTAIVEGLAKRIVEGTVPDVLQQKRIVALDLSLVIAGTMYRGEFESRLKQIIDELRVRPDIILFIDEIHTIVGAGGGNGGNLDAANILKPALAKGEVRCIGATTLDEYRKYIESDTALERRFQSILVEEPSAAEATEILSGLRSYYERFHHIGISRETIQAAIQWSIRYIPDKHLPDKALDLLDEAGARIHTEQPVPAEVTELRLCNRQLSDIRDKKRQAIREEQFDAAVALKKEEGDVIKQREKIEKKVHKLAIPPAPLTPQDVARTLSARVRIPLEYILASGTREYQALEKELRQSIIGQEEAIQQVCSVVKRSYAGLSSSQRPLGSFLFLGPSGVGKTEFAKVLSHALFGGKDALIRLDMSEFAEGFTVSKLIGAPAGYVGYNDRIQLSHHIRQKPYSVVLFDEIEKADPEIFHVLLQILDEGRLTDSAGRELDFRHAIIVLTSNIGLDVLTKQASLGFELSTVDGAKKPVKKEEESFEEVKSTLLRELSEYFPQEFLNRIDHQIVFRPLNRKSVEWIVTRQFQEVQKRLKEKQIRAVLDASAKHCIAQQSFSPEQGARLVRRSITQLIENPLADGILANMYAAGDRIRIQCQKDELIFSKEKKRTTKKRS